MEDLSKKDIEKLQLEIKEVLSALDIPKQKETLLSLEKESLDKNFWKDAEYAREVMDKISYLKNDLETIEKLEENINSLSDLFSSIENKDEQNQLIGEFQKLKEQLEKFSLRRFLSGEYDSYPAVLTIHAGQGGTEANDWTQMLFRMYTMFFEKQGWNYKVTEMTKGTEVGLVTVSMEVKAPLAFGFLKKEHGVHRLVRISPYNAQGLRQTTFAGVEVIPLFEKEEEKLEIPDTDIEFKAVKSGGPGGQNVNKTSSAVQITHIPTGIVVNCSTQRSQAQNRENAMNILKGKLWRIKDEEKLQKLSDIKGDYKIAGWGNQIRNYILHPYKMVKDLRTDIQSNNPEDVLDGNLDKFLEAQVRIE
ncbi:MAG: peptide chain release factor 2 [Candidatus Dojkabacteria bacterium]|jgi:peptide chain release factor 2